jgi:hypothetical protein
MMALISAPASPVTGGNDCPSSRRHIFANPVFGRPRSKSLGKASDPHLHEKSLPDIPPPMAAPFRDAGHQPEGIQYWLFGTDPLVGQSTHFMSIANGFTEDHWHIYGMLLVFPVKKTNLRKIRPERFEGSYIPYL